MDRHRSSPFALRALIATTAGLLGLLSLSGVVAGQSQAAPGPAASPSAACALDKLPLKQAGLLTIGTDNPQYPPWFIGDPPAGSEWSGSYPESGEGYESATAYAIAAGLGFTKDQVKWIYSSFNNLFTPGQTAFDFDIAQISYKPERALAVDFSDAYFQNDQAIVALATNPIKDVTTISGLKPFSLGTAPVGSTGFDTITNLIQPTTDPLVYDDLDKALQLGLLNGNVDGLVVDLGTAIYMRDAQIEDFDTPEPEGVVVGSFPRTASPEYFGVVLDKGSALTPCVNAVIAKLQADGTLQSFYDRWIGGAGGVPIFQP